MYLQIAETWNVGPWWFLWTFVAFVLGSLLTLLLNRPKKVDNGPLIAERDRYHQSATKWEKDYQGVKYRLDESLKTEADLRASLQRCDADKQTLRYRAEKAEASAVMGSTTVPGAENDAPVKFTERLTAVPTDLADAGDDASGGYDGLFESDDFQVIEGIGPRVTEVLHQAGYHNWGDLAVADVDELRRLLNEAGSRFGLSDPAGWPHQAELAAAGDWEELIRYQKFTDAGRETVGDFQTDSKFEKLAAKKLGFSSANPADLKVVEGIGPKIEKLLKAAGIITWDDLAAADPALITATLDQAGNRYRLADPSSWAEQARLATAGDWKELKAMQYRIKQ